MRDEDEPGSGSGLLWYEVGHSDGYSSGETDGFRNGKSHGFRDGTQAALHGVEAKQEAAYRAGWRSIHINDFNAWMEVLNEERRRSAQLVVEVESLRENLAISDRHSDEHRRKLLKTQDFRRGMESCLWALLTAAEQGKSSRPEYAELKSIVYQMNDAWSKGEVLCSPNALGPHIVSLRRALDS
jgi:hypothetical protein